MTSKSNGAARKAVVETENLRSTLMELLDAHSVMAVSTLRPDGWPQTTMVGYVHDDLTIYFAVARTSQKLANILHDSRVSLAMGHQTAKSLRGLSVAGHAVELGAAAEVEHLNTLMRDKYPGESRLAPRERSTAILRVVPEIISIIDVSRAAGEPTLVRVRDGRLVAEPEPVPVGLTPPPPWTPGAPMPWGGAFYRPGAPL